MKTKSLMVGVAVAMSAQFANAQYWNSSNNNLLTAKNNSGANAVYVGIGTNASTSNRLAVSGSTKLDGSLTVTGTSFLSSVTASTNLYSKKNLTVDGSTFLNGTSTFLGKVTMPGGFTSTSASTFNCNVGIGTAPDASRRLSVSGESYFDGKTTFRVVNKDFFIVTGGNTGISIANTSSLNTITSEVQNTYAKLAIVSSELQLKRGDVKVDKNLDVAGKITCHNEIEVTAMNAGSINADGINAKDIKVELPAAADYVFEDNYNLKSLSEVESYVKENKHLPGMPSASEFAEKGMSVSEMSNKLLEKVEELTLHLIQLEKENKDLKEKVNSLMNK
ncbi:MAG: hypothetical protein IKP37_04245 [Paludibacteraceae bacterium]|nr:hypothetical protein [Paludibacteraceae bacterium]